MSQNVKVKLICKNCQQPFQIPKLLPCGESICQNCLDKLTNEASKKGIKCPFCNSNHKIPKNGFPTQKLLQDLIKSEILSDDTDNNSHLMSNLNEILTKIESGLNDVNNSLDGSIEKIQTHCDFMRDEIEISIESIIDELNELKEVLFKEIKNYEEKCKEKIVEKNSKEYVNLKDLIDNAYRKLNNWKQIQDLNEDDLVNIASEAEKLLFKLRNLRYEYEKYYFNDQVMYYKERKTGLDMNILGKLAYRSYINTNESYLIDIDRLNGLRDCATIKIQQARAAGDNSASQTRRVNAADGTTTTTTTTTRTVTVQQNQQQDELPCGATVTTSVLSSPHNNNNHVHRSLFASIVDQQYLLCTYEVQAITFVVCLRIINKNGLIIKETQNDNHNKHLIAMSAYDRYSCLLIRDNFNVIYLKIYDLNDLNMLKSIQLDHLAIALALNPSQFDVYVMKMHEPMFIKFNKELEQQPTQLSNIHDNTVYVPILTTIYIRNEKLFIKNDQDLRLRIFAIETGLVEKVMNFYDLNNCIFSVDSSLKIIFLNINERKIKIYDFNSRGDNDITPPTATAVVDDANVELVFERTLLNSIDVRAGISFCINEIGLIAIYDPFKKTVYLY